MGKVTKGEQLIADYANVKAEIKALNAKAVKLQKQLIDELGITEDSKGQAGDYVYSYSPVKRYSFNVKRSKGFIGLIKRKFGEDMIWSLVKFDHKDFLPFKEKLGKELYEYFDSKTSYVFRVKEVPSE